MVRLRNFPGDRNHHFIKKAFTKYTLLLKPLSFAMDMKEKTPFYHADCASFTFTIKTILNHKTPSIL